MYVMKNCFSAYILGVYNQVIKADKWFKNGTFLKQINYSEF